jgi:hypothetical protein
VSAGLVLALIFGVGYPLVALAVWCIGAFGIAVTMGEVRAAVTDRLKRSGSYIAELQVRWDTASIMWMRIWLTFAVGALWPIALPLWFAWRKGTFVNDVLDRRDAAALALTKDGAA